MEDWHTSGFTALYPLIVPLDALKGRNIRVLQTDSDNAPVTGLCGGIQPDGTLLGGPTPVFAGEVHSENCEIFPVEFPTPLHTYR